QAWRWSSPCSRTSRGHDLPTLRPEVNVCGDVLNPKGLFTRPDATGQAALRREGERTTGLLKPHGVQRRHVPAPLPAQEAGLRVRAPQFAQCPLQAFADGLEEFRQEDPDLASVSDQEALAKLPATECQAQTKLWSDVADRLKKSSDSQ